MLGFQECCDAVLYADAGHSCLVRGWQFCWFEFRALGSTLLNALMYPYGLAPLSHALLLVISLFMMADGPRLSDKWNFKYLLGVRHDNQARLYVKKYLIYVIGGFVLLEFMFMGLASVNLTDVPAGVFAAMAIIGFYRKNALLFALAGGASVLIRAAYLYPMMVLVSYFIVESLYKKSWSRAATSSLFFLCLMPQYWLTYQHLGVFSFLDPSKVEYWRNFHFSSNFAGYDTLIPAAGHPWSSGTTLGFAAAFEQRQWGEVIKLFASRVEFYFASFVPLGKVYLSTAGERIFSPIVFLFHGVALVFSWLYLKEKVGAWRIWVPLSIVMAQNLLIIPEQRFVFVIQLFLVMFAYRYFIRVIENKSV
jgi:hypothetical protein